MATKGSAYPSMRVIPHRPVVTFIKYGIIALVFAISLPAAYYAGTQATQQASQDVETAKAQRQEEIVKELSQELTKLRIDAEVNHQTVEELRQMAMTQKAQLNSYERDLKVYKELLSPGAKGNPLGISFGAFTVFPAAEAGHFNYKLIVQKLSTKDTNFSGFLEFKVLGQRAGKPAQLSLEQISPQVTAASVPLSLKYFQTIEGELQLPPDFTPQTVEVSVNPEDKRSTPIIETQLEWPLSPTNL